MTDPTGTRLGTARPAEVGGLAEADGRCRVVWAEFGRCAAPADAPDGTCHPCRELLRRVAAGLCEVRLPARPACRGVATLEVTVACPCGHEVTVRACPECAAGLQGAGEPCLACCYGTGAHECPVTFVTVSVDGQP